MPCQWPGSCKRGKEYSALWVTLLVTFLRILYLWKSPGHLLKNTLHCWWLTGHLIENTTSAVVLVNFLRILCSAGDIPVTLLRILYWCQNTGQLFKNTLRCWWHLIENTLLVTKSCSPFKKYSVLWVTYVPVTLFFPPSLKPEGGNCKWERE